MTLRIKIAVWIGAVGGAAAAASFAAGLGMGLVRNADDGTRAVYLAAGIFLLLLVGAVSLIGGQLAARRLASLLAQAKLAAYRPDYQEIRMEGQDEVAQLAALINHISSERIQGEEARNRLVSDAAHELRTPVAILRGHMETMLAGAGELKRENLVPLLDETKRMSRLIQELQQLNLAESGRLKLDRSWIRFRHLLREVVEIFGAEAEEKGLALHYADEDDSEVYCDASRIKQVLINLIGNAIRYTPEGGRIDICLQRERDGFIRVEVTDNGAGIEPDKLPYLFHRFFRVDDARNRAAGGTGLGLAIAKQFVEAHGGRLTVASEVGAGTSFVVRLPLFPEM